MHRNKSVALLLSRQALALTRHTPWVDALLSAAHWVKEHGYTLFTSVGMQTWELQVQLATDLNIAQIIVIPVDNETDFNDQCAYYTQQFSLQDSLTHFIQISKNSIDDNLFYLRDRYIIHSADLILPISVRKHGVMDRLLSSVADKEIIPTFSVPFCKHPVRLAQQYNKENMNITIDTITEDFLIHWTRTSFKPWPTETLHNYYTSILSDEMYPRSAYMTLNAILSSRTIIASLRHMPQNLKCVSFTGQNTSTFLRHMRWRSRYSEMSFEPYGIGIRKSSAISYGIQKVIYFDNINFKPHHDRWIYQSRGKKGDWESEDEYRCLGDVNLSHIHPGDILAICKYESEAESIASRHGLQASHFFCQSGDTSPAT